jgi:hypothetical protein
MGDASVVKHLVKLLGRQIMIVGANDLRPILICGRVGARVFRVVRDIA